MIYLFLANGFEEVEALAPLDLLRRAGLSVTTVGIGGEALIGAHGITVQADIPDVMYRDSHPEMVILPGGMPGALHLDTSPTVDAALRAAASGDAYMAAICAAPMVLGKRGYLRGHRATCYPGFEEHLLGATLAKERVVTDGKIVTAAGMGVAVDFGLALVALLCGEEKQRQLRQAILANE